MNKVVIIEGPDGSGKTTLCDWLVEKHNFVRIHEGPPPAGSNKLHYYGAKLIWALQQGQPIVFDRFHLGEMVYGPIKRHTDELGYSGLLLMKRLINAYNVRCYVMAPEYATCHKNWVRTLTAGNDYLQQEDMYFDSYYKFMGLTAYHPIIDFGNTKGYDRRKQELSEYVGNPDIYSFPMRMIGDPSAKYLVVGERANTKDPNLDLPFFYLGNSSKYLNEALWKAGFREDELAFVNAYTCAGLKANLHAKTLLLPNFQVAIALGRKAQEICRDCEVPFVSVNHPSWWKRFKHGDTGLIDELTEVRKVYAHVRCQSASV